MAQSKRFGYTKQTLKINYIEIFGRQPTTQTCRSSMDSDFPIADVRGELQFGNNILPITSRK